MAVYGVYKELCASFGRKIIYYILTICFVYVLIKMENVLLLR
jgi:hypothetical protein